MNKKQFLNDSHVARFIKWASSYVNRWPKSHWVLRSPNNSVEFQFKCCGIEQALGQYVWKSNWHHPKTNKVISSEDWQSTYYSLSKLADGLRNAVNADDDGNSKLWARRILDWGGVKGAREFISNHQDFSGYLRRCNKALLLNTARLDTDPLEKLDSGLTKVHALMALDGLAITDARVLAAVGLLINTWVTNGNSGELPEILTLGHLGAAQNIRLNRKPNGLTSMYANRKRWTNAKIKISWLIEALLNNNKSLFIDRGNLTDRMIAFQAGLFMIGYNIDNNNKETYLQAE